MNKKIRANRLFFVLANKHIRYLYWDLRLLMKRQPSQYIEWELYGGPEHTTIAHTAAILGLLPSTFNKFSLSTRMGLTVACSAIYGGWLRTDAQCHICDRYPEFSTACSLEKWQKTLQANPLLLIDLEQMLLKTPYKKKGWSVLQLCEDADKDDTPMALVPIKKTAYQVWSLWINNGTGEPTHVEPVETYLGLATAQRKLNQLDVLLKEESQTQGDEK